MNILTHCSPNLLILFHKGEIHKGTLPSFLSLIYGTEGLSTHCWIKILEYSPTSKTFWNILPSSTVFHSGMFYNVLLYSIENIFDIQESSRLFFCFLDCSIYIIEQFTNLKCIKHLEKQMTFKKEYIM